MKKRKIKSMYINIIYLVSLILINTILIYNYNHFNGVYELGMIISIILINVSLMFYKKEVQKIRF